MLDDNKLLIGGFFQAVHGTSRKHLARLNADGGLDGTFDPGPGPRSGVIMLSTQPDGTFLAGTDIAGVRENYDLLTRLHADGSRDITFTPGGGILEQSFCPAALQPDGKVLFAGVYDRGDGTVIRGLCRLHADGSLDTGFQNHFLGRVSSILLQPDGTMFISGLLQSSPTDGSPAIVARLHADGSVDPSFSPERLGPNHPGPVTGYRMSRQADGGLLCAGDYYLPAAFEPENEEMGIIQGLYRLNPDASVDAAFNPGGGFPLSVDSFVLQPDGGVIISHGFEPIKGVMRPFLTRLKGHAVAPPQSFADWASSFGLSGAAAAAGADPDADGLPNGAEYVLGGNPVQPAPAGRPAAGVNDGNMVFTFSRDDASETPDVTLTVETGTDLLTWPTAFSAGSNTAASSPGVTITENGTAPDTITVTIPQGAAQTKFARLKVTITP